MEIRGATGKGLGVGVTNDYRLKVSSITHTSDYHINHVDEESYSVEFSITPSTAGCCFGYIKNTNNINMIISSFGLWTEIDETFIIKLNDIGTPIGGNTIIPVNRNAGSGNQAIVISEVGTEITGFSGGSIVSTLFKVGGESTSKWSYNSGLILPKNKYITFYVTKGTSPIRFGCSISFHNIGE